MTFNELVALGKMFPLFPWPSGKASFLLSIHPKAAWPRSSKLLKHRMCTTHVALISWLMLLIIFLYVAVSPNLAVKCLDKNRKSNQAGWREEDEAGGWAEA